MIISVLIAIVIAAFLVVMIMLVRNLKKENRKAANNVQEKIQKKGKSTILKEAQKKLSKDPHNIQALMAVGDICFSEKNWEKVYGAYKTLYELSSAHSEIDVAKVTLRMGISAQQLGKPEEALNALMLSYKKDPDSIECNFCLGKVLYEKEIYDKAIACLKKVKIAKPDNQEANLLIGNSLFKMHKFRESLTFFKSVLDESPDNKEVLYNMAMAMTEVGYGEKALKLFMHLRPDPQYGPQSCLEAGKMHEKVKNYQAAIQDYDIAFKLQNVPEQVLIQIKYRAASSYIALNDIPKALAMLKQIQTMKAGYKDVEALIACYSELNQNKNLQVYLMSGTSEFIALCRKFISTYYKDAFVKVEDVAVESDSVDIRVDIEHPRWTAKQLFRFYRSQSTISDIFIRECHSKMRDTKCDKALCVTMGFFSESAHKFVEGRPIDLMEKEALSRILQKINIIG